MTTLRHLPFLALLLTCFTCQTDTDLPAPAEPAEGNSEPTDTLPFQRGADLSYVNEMLDCGATYADAEGNTRNPYDLFADAGTDLARVRLWHDPDWTEYSDFADVRRTIAAAKARGMNVLLDFHYSDEWADPEKQYVPAAWLPVVNDRAALGDSVYNYTLRTLTALAAEGLSPEMVQVGNETNREILQDPADQSERIDWERNAFLLNRGLAAAREAARRNGQPILTVLHIAQPENAEWWFREARAAGMLDYDVIGVSYYPQWSSVSLAELPTAVRDLRRTYGKEVMIVETAYPFALDNVDEANNILGSDALLPEFPATPTGQLNYLRALETAIRAGGGAGLIYWEPAWVSTDCRTRWGRGSHWDNATLFGRDGRALVGMSYFGG